MGITCGRADHACMATIDGPAGPSMATRSAIDGPARPVVAGDHLRRDIPLLANPITFIGQH